MARTLLQRLILLLKPPEGQQHLKRHLTVGPYKLPEAVGPRRRARAGGGSAQSNDRATRCKSWGGGARVGAVGWREGAGACRGRGGGGLRRENELWSETSPCWSHGQYDGKGVKSPCWSHG